MLALDLDLAIAARARAEEDEQLQEVLNGGDGAFFSAVIALLDRNNG